MVKMVICCRALNSGSSWNYVFELVRLITQIVWFLKIHFSENIRMSLLCVFYRYWNCQQQQQQTYSNQTHWSHRRLSSSPRAQHLPFNSSRRTPRRTRWTNYSQSGAGQRSNTRFRGKFADDINCTVSSNWFKVLEASKNTTTKLLWTND